MNRKPPSDDPPPVGRVRRDPQGNAVWEWAAATGRQALDSTSRLLRKLEVPGLKLLDEEGGAKPGEEDPASKPSAKQPNGAPRNTAQGYDPYGGRGAAVAARVKPAATRAKAPTVKKKSSFLSRLFGRR